MKPLTLITQVLIICCLMSSGNALSSVKGIRFKVTNQAEFFHGRSTALYDGYSDNDDRPGY